MSRRPAAIPLAVAALVLAAGCLGAVPGDIDGPDIFAPTTPTTTDPTTRPTPTATPDPTPVPTPETITPQSHPWKPDPLRAANVEVFVREYERTVQHNELVGPSVVEVKLSCRATLVAEIDGGYLVRAECGGSIHQRDGDGATTVGAFAPERVTYFVDDETVQRIDGADRRLDPYRADDGGLNVASPEGVAVVNAADRSREIGIVVRYDGEADEPVLAAQYSLGPGEGLDLRRVAARQGTYNVTVEVGNETAARYRWRVASENTARSGGVGVVVTPDGDVLVVDLPRMQ